MARATSLRHRLDLCSDFCEVVCVLICKFATFNFERARVAQVRGRNVTPFLLSALDQGSGGDIVDTNIALVEANARLAAQIAVADQDL